jgi:site-specific DNA recombinase
MTERAERAAIYARVSTDEQVEGTSLDTQLERCRAYVESQGWSVAAEFVDEGVSGATASRPALDRLMAAVRAGSASKVVVAKLDRFGRSVRHLSALLGELDDKGVQFVSVAERIDGSTPTGRLQRTLLSSFAEFERERIRERMEDGLAAVARSGYWPGGPPPFGYRIVQDGRHARLEVDPTEQEVVLRAVGCLVDQGMSARETANYLNANGLVPRRAARWTPQHLRRQLVEADGLSGRWTYKRPSRKGKAGRDPGGRYGPPIVLDIPPILSAERHETLKAVLASTRGPCGIPICLLEGGLRRRAGLLCTELQNVQGGRYTSARSHGIRFLRMRDALAERFRWRSLRLRCGRRSHVFLLTLLCCCEARETR